MQFSLKEFLKEQFIVPQFGKKFLIMILGIFFMGFFLSFLICIGWGTDPYSFQNKIISTRIGWLFGTWQLCLNALMFVIVVIWDRRVIGFGTIANMVFVGYISDFFVWLWSKVIPSAVFTDASYLALKIALFAVSLILFAVAASFYINAQMGLSPYDALATLIGKKLNRIPQALTRIAFDMTAVVVGILVSLGTDIPIKTALIGSIAMGLLLGPMIQLVGRFTRSKLLAS